MEELRRLRPRRCRVHAPEGALLYLAGTEGLRAGAGLGEQRRERRLPLKDAAFAGYSVVGVGGRPSAAAPAEELRHEELAAPSAAVTPAASKPEQKAAAKTDKPVAKTAKSGAKPAKAEAKAKMKAKVKAEIKTEAMASRTAR